MTPINYINIHDLKVWETNYNEGDIGALSVGIRRYGFAGVIKVWKDGEVRGGNHTLMAVRLIQQEGHKPDLDADWPPANIHVDGDKWLVPTISIEHLTESEALAFAIWDNKSAFLASQNEELLLEYLSDLYTEDKDLFHNTGYNEDDLNYLSEVLSPPSLDQLKQTYNDHDETLFWPVYTVKLHPDVLNRLQDYLTSVKGDNDSDKINGLLDLADQN